MWDWDPTANRLASAFEVRQTVSVERISLSLEIYMVKVIGFSILFRFGVGRFVPTIINVAYLDVALAIPELDISFRCQSHQLL